MIAAAVGAIAATTLAGGVAWATIPAADGTINGCYLKGLGTLRVIDPGKGGKCSDALETPISWNQKGLKGDPGTNGTNGINGVDGVSPTVVQLPTQGDANCPAGGVAITDAASHTAYLCNGVNGQDGTNGQDFAGAFTSPNGDYSLNVTDTGITLSSHGTQATIKITGSNIEVTSGQDTTIKAGNNASIDATNNFSIKGSGTGLVKSAGVLTIQGSSVNVN